MTYPDPTTEQMLVIAVAVMVPLVWAFMHHGRSRMIALMLWIPLWLFVARVVSMNRIPTAPLETRLRRALMELAIDPMTIAWPTFVFLTFGLIHIFAARRQRREANPQAGASVNLPVPRVTERPTEPGPKKRCLGCNRRVPISAGMCPHCGYSFSPPRPQQAATQTLPTSPPEPPRPQHQVQRERSVDVADTVVAERLRMLGALRDDGLLTDAEFQAKTSAVLAMRPRPASAMRAEST